MTDEELEALLEELEAALAEDVRAALVLTAQDFADALEGATELVAARFSVSGIRNMWRRRVGGIVDRLRSIARRGATVVADDSGEELPDGWDSSLTSYTEATTALLNAVGDQLAAEASLTLAEGLNAGEGLEQLKARLAAVFDTDGTQLGDSRARRIAVTEATRAFNAGTLAAAQALTGPDRPLVKQWLTRNDERVRPTHRNANGQIQLLDDPFDVGGTPMLYPGDPTAPANETVNCRCVMRASTPARTASTEGNTMDDEATASADVHTGAMIALMPTEEDAARLALEGGEAADQLHLTLFYLGAAADWSAEQQSHLISRVASAARYLKPVPARAFGAAQWNPGSEEPAWVWNVGNDADHDGSRLEDAKNEITYALEDGHDDPPLPQQYTPWSPHVCAVYSGDDWTTALADRVGPVTFDRVRVAFAGQYTDFPLTGESISTLADVDYAEPATDGPPTVASWSTPGATALAFENQQTGDGRVFTPGALYWSDGPWPLQYADELSGGHEGAQLAGAIHTMGRDGNRIAASGVLYLTQPAGVDAAVLLAQGAPLGVSVDLDDVDISMVDATPGAAEAYALSLATASMLPLPDGGWRLTGETAGEWTASGVDGLNRVSQRVDVVVGADGTVPNVLVELAAAAGDPDVADGLVVESQRSGDYLMRITRARVRGATLVTIPAYADARIVLDDASRFASYTPDEVTAAIKSTTDYDRVLRHVRASKVACGAARVAQQLRMPVVAAQRILAVAASRGEVVRLTRGLYTDKTTSARADHLMYDDMVASVTGAVDLPVADRDTAWDGDAAKDRVFAWADGDTAKVSKAFAYRDDDADPSTEAAWKLGYADVLGGALTIIPKGVSAALGAMNGARGGVDIPDSERAAVLHHLESVRSHVVEETGGEDLAAMAASAWAAMKDLPPMPAAWFAEPTAEELPPGGPGVNYSNGRIFGWVAQADEPHAGFAKKITINSLGRIDTTHFLRQRFTLDDGSTVKAGSFTMNAGHHRDGAECETSACQFDDTRTVAGIVTVGMNSGGMWFSGAAAPWLSEWDRSVFMSTQPSYHLKRGTGGNWQLRAVLAVPVPGHSSPLLASAVVERSRMALTASATMAEVEEATLAEEARQASTQAVEDTPLAIDYDRLANSLVAAMARAEDRKAAEAAELAALMAEAAKLDPDITGTEGN